MCLFGQSYREKERVSVCWSLPRRLRWPALGQTEARRARHLRGPDVFAGREGGGRHTGALRCSLRTEGRNALPVAETPGSVPSACILWGHDVQTASKTSARGERVADPATSSPSSPSPTPSVLRLVALQRDRFRGVPPSWQGATSQGLSRDHQTGPCSCFSEQEKVCKRLLDEVISFAEQRS